MKFLKLIPNQFQIFLLTYTFCFLIILMPQIGITQSYFTNLYGKPTDEYFTSVIPDGQGFFVLGLENGMTTSVPCINSAGVWLWTYRMNINSVWFDGVIAPDRGNPK